MEFLTTTFTAPSGTQYTIREQNGQDEEILTNTIEANRGMNITNFLQGIIMSTSKKDGKLTTAEVLDLPCLDRACIMLQSRIFSIGEELVFTHRWLEKGDPEKYQDVEYSQDLREFLFDDYGCKDTISPEELAKAIQEKPKAIPFYPSTTDEYITLNLKSGKKARFKVSNGHTELYLLNLKESEQTRNSNLIARHLELQVDGKWERVFNFSLFSIKDMQEIRKAANAYDPVPDLTVNLCNPETGEFTEIPLFAISDFFFPEGDV